MQLWEILVPTLMGGTNKPIRTRYHRVWDEKVRHISGGLTVMTPVRGQWMNNGYLFKERMIPVRIMCSREQIQEIIQFTMKYYNQIAVMAYKISDDVIMQVDMARQMCGSTY